MNISDFVKNELIHANYELAKKAHVSQNDYYEVQRDNCNFRVVE